MYIDKEARDVFVKKYQETQEILSQKLDDYDRLYFEGVRDTLHNVANTIGFDTQTSDKKEKTK